MAETTDRIESQICREDGSDPAAADAMRRDLLKAAHDRSRDAVVRETRVEADLQNMTEGEIVDLAVELCR